MSPRRYHNPLDNVPDLAHHFFSRCLEAKVTPYVVTKKTVFKWQEGFWQAMKKVFDESYKTKCVARCALARCSPRPYWSRRAPTTDAGQPAVVHDAYDPLPPSPACRYVAAGLLDKCGGELPHLISDAATMQIIRWTDGGFGMAAHNYDGDMLTDEVAQVHRSPGFITSNLIGKRDDGTMIKEFEASHGTVADMWHAHLRGEETSLNP